MSDPASEEYIEEEAYLPPLIYGPGLAAFSRIIEAPWPLVRRQEPALIPLFARDDAITSTFALWSSFNLESYIQHYIGAARYATLGLVGTDYPADTRLIDDQIGLDVLLQGYDTIEGVTVDDALADTLLAFVGNEIISVRDVTFTAANRVLLTGHIRGRYCTPREAHSIGDAVLFIRRDQIRLISDPRRFRHGDSYSGWTWKFQPIWFNRATPLDEISPMAEPVFITSKSCRPMPPVNLSVNGQYRTAQCTWGSDMVSLWDLTDWRAEAFWQLFLTPYTPVDIVSRIEVYDAADALVRRVELAAGVKTWTYDAAAQAADFASQPASFKVRVTSIWDGYPSLTYEEVVVTT